MHRKYYYAHWLDVKRQVRLSSSPILELSSTSVRPFPTLHMYICTRPYNAHRCLIVTVSKVSHRYCSVNIPIPFQIMWVADDDLWHIRFEPWRRQRRIKYRRKVRGTRKHVGTPNDCAPNANHNIGKLNNSQK